MKPHYLLAILLPVLISCSDSTPPEPVDTPPPPPLATSGSMMLEQDDFCQRLAASPLTPPLEIVQSWSEEAALLEEAYKRELHLRPDVIQKSRRAVQQVLLAELETELVSDVDPPGRREIRRWWDRNFHSFRVERPMVRAQVFGHSRPDSAARVRELLLQDVSVEWIRKQMPHLQVHDSGFLYREELRPELATCLFDSVAAISPVLTIGATHYLLKRTATRDPNHHFTEAEVSGEISARILGRERTRLLASWRQELLEEIEIEIDTVRVIAISESLLTTD